MLINRYLTCYLNSIKANKPYLDHVLHSLYIFRFHI